MIRRTAALMGLALAAIMVGTFIGPEGGPTEVSGAAVVATVGAGSSSDHTCAVTATGGVKCWGRNHFGQLGDGTTFDRLAPVDVKGLETGVVSVSTGNGHSCAVTAASGVKCWGRNNYGQLGDGLACGYTCTTAVGVVGLSDGVASVSTGYVHSCALTTEGVVKCWGNNFHGQLGVGGAVGNHQTAPMDVFNLSSGVTAMAAGDWHTCAVTATGGVRCWGENLVGQLGDGGCCIDRTAPVNVSGLSSGIVEVATGAVHTCAVTTAGGVKCWGRNTYGQLGDGTTTNHFTPGNVVGLNAGVVSVLMGNGHSCAVTATGGVTCWGRNNYGQLGDGTTTNQPLPVDVKGLASDVAAVGGGSTHTCALTAAGYVNCWGRNSDGQLGDGTSMNRTAPVSPLGLKPTPTLTPTPTATATATATPTATPDPTDTDGDGCSDERENGPDEKLGGQRDFLNEWDFYDVLGPGGVLPTDGFIDLPNDILGVIQHHPAGTIGYDAQFDRGTWTGINSWNDTQGPDGVIDLPNDILGIILQFNHNCN